MTIKQIMKIYNDDGATIGFKETKKNKYYLKKYQGSSYILVFEKGYYGDEIKGFFSQDDFIFDKIMKIFNEIE